MINEEIARKTLNMEVKAGKVTAKLLLTLLKKLMKEAEKLGGLEKLVSSKGNEVKLSAWNNKIKVMSIRTKLEHIQAPDKSCCNLSGKAVK